MMVCGFLVLVLHSLIDFRGYLLLDRWEESSNVVLVVFSAWCCYACWMIWLCIHILWNFTSKLWGFGISWSFCIGLFYLFYLIVVVLLFKDRYCFLRSFSRAMNFFWCKFRAFFFWVVSCCDCLVVFRQE